MTRISTQQAFDLAVKHHDAGRYPQAESLYRQILQQLPDNPDVLHRLGILASQLGRNDLAKEYILRAIAVFPSGAEFYGNLGLVTCALGDSDAGVAAYRRALELRPNYPEALSNLGNALRPMGQPEEAVELCKRAILLRPNFAEAYNNMGNALLDMKDLDGAIAAYRRALELKPSFAEAVNNLGGALLDLDKTDEAIECYHRALEIRPNYADALNNLANAVGNKGDKQQAIDLCKQALKERPDFPEALNTLTNLYNDTHESERALETGHAAIKLRPIYPECHNNIGNAYYEMDRLEEAMAEYRVSISQRPNYFQAHNNLGNSLHAAGRLEEAEISCRKAVSIDPTFPAAHWNLALVLLLKGDFKNGWPEYEWRWKVKELRPPRISLPGPAWQGENLKGKTILVYTEQGFGDSLQFVRFAPLLKAQGARVLLIAQPEVLRLLRNAPGVDAVYPMDITKPPEQYDYHHPLLSVPHTLGMTTETIPREIPYLTPDPVDVEKWRNRMEGEKRLKIGISWAGRATHANDRKRSTTLATFAPLAKLEGIRLFSLQKGERSAEISDAPEGLNITDWASELNDFSDTAGLIANLDLLISVDTSVVHLAGAMNKPAWMLLPYIPDWRWMLHRTDTPWYPTVKLYRQPKLWDYQTPMMEIVKALQKRLEPT